MVIVEASAFGIPIICFKNAGGAQEFVDKKVGFISPFLDTNAVESYLQKVIGNKNFKNKNSAYIKEKSKKSHDININGEEIFSKIHEIYLW